MLKKKDMWERDNPYTHTHNPDSKWSLIGDSVIQNGNCDGYF